MKKTIVIILLLNIFCFAADNATETNVAEETKPANIVTLGITLNINNDAIHSGHVIDPLLPQLKQIAISTDQRSFETQASQIIYQETMRQISEILLYQKAKKQLAKNGEVDDIIARIRLSKMQTLIKNYGGNEALARAELSKKAIDIDEVLDSAVRAVLVSNYRDTYFQTTKSISRADMIKYYQEHLEEFTLERKIQFQLIDIRFDQVGGKDQANELANELMAQLSNNADFSAMVQKYSNGFLQSKNGIWPEMKIDNNGNAEGLKELYQPVIAALSKTKPNQHSGIIECADRFFVAKLLKKQDAGTISFTKAQLTIKNKLHDLEWAKIGQKLQKQMENEAVFGYLPTFCSNTTRLAYQKIMKEELANAKQ
ncbi:MAG: peptidyl-prolyl cis-trans isomerase [Phycisphaerae bacterium]|nr:peptidyl-prolyl cis-trans isomerase [Phycisphaerae bacterium]